jgi:hypothetical protein
VENPQKRKTMPDENGGNDFEKECSLQFRYDHFSTIREGDFL